MLLLDYVKSFEALFKNILQFILNWAYKRFLFYNFFEEILN